MPGSSSAIEFIDPVQPKFDLLVADARVLNPDRADEGLQRADILIDGGRIARLGPAAWELAA
jgi:hypothetical protein